MRIVALLAVAALAGASACRSATAADVATPAPPPATPVVEHVRSVTLDGHHLPLAALRQLLSSQPGSLLSADALARDRAAMERALIARGYLAAVVAPASVTHGPAGDAYVVFDLVPGPLFHLRSIAVTGPGKDAGVQTLSPGDPAIGARLDDARTALAAALARRGRSGVVALSVRTDVAAAAVDVELATR